MLLRPRPRASDPIRIVSSRRGGHKDPWRWDLRLRSAGAEQRHGRVGGHQEDEAEVL